MPQYRRWRQAGGTYFFTVNLQDRRQRLLVDQVDALRAAVAAVKKVHPFDIDASVILPNHLHMIWTLPKGDDDFSTRWRLIKTRFSIRFSAATSRRSSKQHKREKGIWQRRFYEHLIRDDHDLNEHIDYIHFNPVKHGHADRPVDWPYSSIHRFIRQGTLTADWGTNGMDSNLDLG